MGRKPADTGQSDTNRPLPETGKQGLERLRELERLLKTARDVRDNAEIELKEGFADPERVRLRLDAAVRMQRKVEREIIRLRSDLAAEHPEVNRIWTPGDPVSGVRRRAAPASPPSEVEPPKPEDFELSMMLGSQSTRWKTKPAQFDLDRETSVSQRAVVPEKRVHKPATSRPTPTVTPHATGRRRASRGRRRSLLIGLLLIVGMAAGASATYVLILEPEQTPFGQWRLEVNPLQWWQEIRGAGTAAVAAVPEPARAEATAPVSRAPAAKPAASAIAREEQRQLEAARKRFNARMQSLRQASTDASLF